MSKVTNHDARDLVRAKETFKTGNKTIFAEWRGNVYTVYSYGYHFPMYVFDQTANAWYGNQDKYSRTTTGHQSKTRPEHIDKWFSTDQLKRVSEHGISGLVQQRMEEAIRQ